MAPPSTGDLWVGLSPDPLPIAGAHSFLADPRSGGTCVFVGTTRRWTGAVETTALDYHAYPAMAERSLRDLASGVLSSAAHRVVVLHRTGVVKPTEASVIVGVASAHRDLAFRQCRHLIDRLKADTPIWKHDLP